MPQFVTCPACDGEGNCSFCGDNMGEVTPAQAERYKQQQARHRREPRPADQPDDTDPNNPADVGVDAWRDIMSDPDYEDTEP